jgi:predicted ATPase
MEPQSDEHPWIDPPSASDSSMTDSLYSCRTPVGTTPNTPKLFGRDQELSMLLDSYQEISKSNSSKVVVVHGASGSGKTSLVDAIRHHVATNNGYFCSGKFFQNSNEQEPYSAIVASCCDLCDLVYQSADYEQRRGIIQEKLSSHGRLLAKTISSLTPFLAQTEADDYYYTEEGSNKNEAVFSAFKVACKTFLQVMPCPEHPVVLV